MHRRKVARGRRCATRGVRLVRSVIRLAGRIGLQRQAVALVTAATLALAQ